MTTKSVAIVTGASQGIGRATALRLARDFSAVVLVARDKDNLEKTAARSQVPWRRNDGVGPRPAPTTIGKDRHRGDSRTLWQNRCAAQYCGRSATD